MIYGNNDDNKDTKKNEPGVPAGWIVAIVALCMFGAISMYNDIKSALNKKDKCILCSRDAEEGSLYCYYHENHRYDNMKSNSDRYRETHTTATTQSAKPSTTRATRKTTTEHTVDPSEHDIDAYYEDYKDEFDDEDDAWDDFEDNDEYWDDY